MLSQRFLVSFVILVFFTNGDHVPDLKITMLSFSLNKSHKTSLTVKQPTNNSNLEQKLHQRS